MNPSEDAMVATAPWSEGVWLHPATFQELLNKPLRVLLADDEETIVISSLELFKREGWDGEGATNGPAALERLEHDEFDVVILDYKMPGNEGLQLLHRIADLYPNLPVIIITG